MPGKGKYTTYNVPATDPKKPLLEKMFKGAGDNTPPFIGLDQQKATAEAVARGNNILRAKEWAGAGENPLPAGDGIVDSGDIGFGKVDLTFQGRGLAITPPNTLIDSADGKAIGTGLAGMPASPYFPDITSPGPGKTEGVDKEGAGPIAPQEVRPQLNFDPKTATVNTRAPFATSKKVYDANTLGDDETIKMAKPGEEQFGS